MMFEYANQLYLLAGFDPNQPREPEGSPQGGQWTDGVTFKGKTSKGNEILVRYDPETESATAVANGQTFNLNSAFTSEATLTDGTRVIIFDVKGGGKIAIPMSYSAELKTFRSNILMSADKALERKFPGISALKAASNDSERYSRQFDRMMENEFNDGVNPPKAVKVDYATLAARYPSAATYLKAESYEDASNYQKSAAGRKAKQLLKSNPSAVDKANAILDGWLNGVNID